MLAAQGIDCVVTMLTTPFGTRSSGHSICFGLLSGWPTMHWRPSDVVPLWTGTGSVNTVKKAGVLLSSDHWTLRFVKSAFDPHVPPAQADGASTSSTPAVASMRRHFRAIASPPLCCLSGDSTPAAGGRAMAVAQLGSGLR